MRLLFAFLLVFISLLHAQPYFAKLEPHIRVTLDASVGGIVAGVEHAEEGSVLDRKPFVVLDSEVDRKRLETLRQSRELLEENIAITRQSIQLLQETAERMLGIYRRYKRVASATQRQKDEAFRAYASAQAQYLNAKERLVSLKRQLQETALSITQVKDTLRKKRFAKPGWYLEALFVQAGEYVAPGVPIARVSDLSEGELVFYLSAGEIERIKDKKIFVDGKPTDLKIEKIWRVTDEKHLSQYKARILVPAPKWRFGKLLKIEFKQGKQ